MQNDTEFGDAECALRRHERFFTDQQYIDGMVASRLQNQFIVQRVPSNAFRSVEKLL